MTQQDTAAVADNSLAILYPNQTLTLGGEQIELKEYTLKQQLQYRARFMPFIGTLRANLSEAQAHGEFDLDALLGCVAEHYDDVLFLVALSCGKSEDWVGNLSGEDAEGLLTVWWAVNSDFFTRQAVSPLLEKMAKAKQAEAIAALTGQA